MSTVKSKKLQVGTDATSSNNFTIYQPATPDGTLRIGVGNADSPTEVGRFNSNGYVATNAPAFSASSAGQSVSNSTWTKIAYSTEQFDTNSEYDSTTNYRFLPSVAGYYQINVSAAMNTGTPFQIASAIYKNGSPYSYGTNTTGSFGSVSTVLLYLNGSTDYVEGYCLQASGGSLNTVNSVFSGILVKAT